MTLETRQLTSSYGMSQILFGIDLSVEASETVCILGRNGVGKTTTLKTIMGMVRPLGGSVRFEGQEIGGLPPHEINRKGIGYVPQGRHIFPNLTTRENLVVAERRGKDPKTEWNLRRIHDLFPVLKKRESFMGRSLSGGEQQMLAIARGLMQNPAMLLLDEICEGLAPLVVKELEEIIGELRKTGVSILIAEQNVKFAVAVSRRCYILEKGQVVYSGNTAEIPPATLLKYLGA
jgi:branched-chain amino acid transport system ATP-binding protein